MSSPGKLQDGEIYLGNYLLERLLQLDVNVMTGVPVGYSLQPPGSLIIP